MTTTSNVLYLNNHGDTFTSINAALAGILNWALFNGAEKSDCEDCQKEIIKAVLTTPVGKVKDALANGHYCVRGDGALYDVGYLLSERF